MNMRLRQCRGQSLVEYVVVLALIAILAASVLAGVGQRSRDRLMAANQVLRDNAVATSTSPKGK
jgi:type II secretory pathway pseudopilin PulG